MGAKMVMVAVQHKSDSIDLGGMLRSELTVIASRGYPTEIFEVTPRAGSARACPRPARACRRAAEAPLGERCDQHGAQVSS
ncbi:MAG: hypothetical protein ACRDNP_06960 [Gaiellaceae bacterium]